MKIVITGCSGYVGPTVLRNLKASYPDAMIVGIDSGLFMSQHEDESPSPETCIDQMIYKDVRDLTLADFEDVDHVVQLAAVSNDPLGDRFARVTSDVNATAVIQIADLARRAGAKSCTFASSASVYGAGSSFPRDEASDLAPQTAYARSKIEAEQGLSQLADDNYRTTALRFSTACGWSPRVRLDLVLNDFVASALTTGSIEVLSDGSPWRPLIHVRDMARAVAWSISDERDNFDAYLVSNVGREDWNFQIRDLAHAVADVLGGVEVRINVQAQPDTRSYRVDFQNWRKLAPRHQPIEDLQSTIGEMAMKLSKLADLNQDFRKSNRLRLNRITELQRFGYLTEELRWRVLEEES